MAATRLVVDRPGVFDKAVEMMREAKRLGCHVITNTTIFKETDIKEIEELCAFLAHDIDVDGMLISPGYQYESVEPDIFLTRNDVEAKFKRALQLSRSFRVHSSPMFLEFAAGLRKNPADMYRMVKWNLAG